MHKLNIDKHHVQNI